MLYLNVFFDQKRLFFLNVWVIFSEVSDAHEFKWEKHKNITPASVTRCSRCVTPSNQTSTRHLMCEFTPCWDIMEDRKLRAVRHMAPSAYKKTSCLVCLCFLTVLETQVMFLKVSEMLFFPPQIWKISAHRLWAKSCFKLHCLKTAGIRV